jgi:DNA-binding NtrC family response regulator
MARDRVVVIDDDRDFREMVDLCLAGAGLVTLGAGTCCDALPILERERGRLRLVLVDYFMPGLAPVACVRAIFDRVDPGVPVVLVSAAVDVAARAAEVGLRRFLAKPFDIADLMALVGGEPP